MEPRLFQIRFDTCFKCCTAELAAISTTTLGQGVSADNAINADGAAFVRHRHGRFRPKSRPFHGVVGPIASNW